MKARFALVSILVVVCMISAIGFTEEAQDELHYDRYYILLPELDIRAEAEIPGAVDTLYSGQEVEVLEIKGNYANFKYVKEGETEEKFGATWVGAISPAVRIHLLEDEYIFHRPFYDLEEFGHIAAWREPSDPDFFILWEETIENQKWYFVVTMPDCRAGYMRGTAKFEVTE